MTLSYIHRSYDEFSGKICKFSLPWQWGLSDQSLTDTIKFADPEKLKTPYCVQTPGSYLLHKLSYSRFCVEIRKFSLPWQHGSL